MKRNWILHGAKIAFFVVVAVAVVSFIVMALWNWLVPAITGWSSIDFWQALGLLALSRILFGLRVGFGFGHRGHWRGRMAERWQSMTPEEREKFREGMQARCGHRSRAPAPDAPSA
jgi:hypothetical protein